MDELHGFIQNNFRETTFRISCKLSLDKLHEVIVYLF